jgi:hypothetical protein
MASELDATAWGWLQLLQNRELLPGVMVQLLQDRGYCLGFSIAPHGVSLTAPSYAETVMGRYNTLYTPNGITIWNSNDRLFVIGNGSSSNRSDALNLKMGHRGKRTKYLLQVNVRRCNELVTIHQATVSSNGMLDWPNSNAALHVLHPNISNEGIRIQNLGANNRHWTLHTNNGAGTLILYSSINGSTPVGNFNGSTGAYSATSNRHLKADITMLDADVLARIKQLEPSRYRYLRDPGNQFTIGFIAEDVQPLFPELVETIGEEGENMAVNYAGFSVVAIKAIQEQQKIIDIMMGIIENQNERIEELRENSKEKNVAIATLKAEKDTEIESLITRLTALEAMMDLPAGNTRVSLD